MNKDQKAYESLLAKVRQVFAKEINEGLYSETQKDLLDGFLDEAVAYSGGPDKVTLDQVKGCKDLMDECGLAAAS
jgi:hypothetical protein